MPADDLDSQVPEGPEPQEVTKLPKNPVDKCKCGFTHGGATTGADSKNPRMQASELARLALTIVDNSLRPTTNRMYRAKTRQEIDNKFG